MVSARHGEARIHVSASPDEVWSMLADVERMGEWSPECYRVAWLGGASSPAQVGARFKGFNRSGKLAWSMTCQVQVADPGVELAWSTMQGRKEVVRWTYRMVPTDGGTELVESFDAKSWPLKVRIFEDYVMRNRDDDRDAAMQATLQRIKAAAEAHG
jgi:hypothetical protein